MDINIAKPETKPMIDEQAEYSVTYIIALLAFTMFVVVTSEFVVVALLPSMAIELMVYIRVTAALLRNRPFRVRYTERKISTHCCPWTEKRERPAIAEAGQLPSTINKSDTNRSMNTSREYKL